MSLFLQFYWVLSACLPVDIKNCSVHSDPMIFFGGCFRYNRGSDFVRNVALEVSKSNYAYEFEGKMSPSK